MATAEEYEATRGALRRLVSEPAPGIALLEFSSLPQLREILADLHHLHPERPPVEVEYDPAHDDAAHVLARIRAHPGFPAAAAVDSPPGVILLHPHALPDAARDLAIVRQFWRGMNFWRENWGALRVQLILCVDPWQNGILTEYAADLRSWAMPRLHLLPPPDLAAAREQALGAFPTFANLGLDAKGAELRWESLWPRLEAVCAERPLQPDDFSRYLLPLLEAALAQGNLVRARSICAFTHGLQPPPRELIRWHRLHGFLGIAEGDFPGAEEHALQLLRLARETADPDLSLAAGDAAAELARLLSRHGQPGMAGPLHRQIGQLREERLGPDDPRVLVSRGELALCLKDQGNFEDAEKESRAVLEGRERVLGPEHPATLTGVNNLASLLDSKGEPAAAEPLYRRALEGSERVLGPEHPDTLSSVNNLAYLLQAKGELAAAEPLHRRALEGRERVLGHEHPDTLGSVNNLAYLLQAKGELAAAEPLFRRALEGCERVLGPEHPNTLTSVNNLAALLDSKGELAAAEPLYRRALEGQERVLGIGHPDTCLSYYNLARFLEDAGRRVAAKPLALAAYRGWKAVYGENHEDTRDAKALLGRLGVEEP